MIKMTLKGYFSYLDLVVDYISMIANNSIQRSAELQNSKQGHLSKFWP